MALFRRDSLTRLRYMLKRMEETLVQLRELQRGGHPRADPTLNIILRQWQQTHDQLVLADYERWAMDHQSPRLPRIGRR